MHARCAHCKGRHKTVADYRACSEAEAEARHEYEMESRDSLDVWDEQAHEQTRIDEYAHEFFHGAEADLDHLSDHEAERSARAHF